MYMVKYDLVKGQVYIEDDSTHLKECNPPLKIRTLNEEVFERRKSFH